MEIILASNSPRRKEILENVGLSFSVLTSGADERSDATSPAEFVKDLALCKGRAVYDRLCRERGKDKTDEILMISADTVVVSGEKILGKPHSRDEVIEMLSLLSGKEHQVMTGIALHYRGRCVSAYESTDVIFDPLTLEDIEKYADTSEPYDKAGSYAIQGISSKFIKKINGCYFNVVGLPLHKLYTTVRESFGIELY